MNCDGRANTEDCHRQACYLVMDGTAGNHKAIDSRRPGNGPLPVCTVQPQHLSTICGDLFPVHPSAALGAAAVVFCFAQEPMHEKIQHPDLRGCKMRNTIEDKGQRERGSGSGAGGDGERCGSSGGSGAGGDGEQRHNRKRSSGNARSRSDHR